MFKPSYAFLDFSRTNSSHNLTLSDWYIACMEFQTPQVKCSKCGKCKKKCISIFKMYCEPPNCLYLWWDLPCIVPRRQQVSMNVCDWVSKTVLRSNFFISLVATNSKNLVQWSLVIPIKVGISMEENVHWWHFWAEKHFSKWTDLFSTLYDSLWNYWVQIKMTTKISRISPAGLA